MKISYHHAYLVDPEIPSVRYAWNPSRLLGAFVDHAPAGLKRLVVGDGGESLYVFRGRGGRGNAFLFVMSKDHDFIRKINSEQISQEDIRNTLQRNEEIGFASYVYTEAKYYGLGGVMGGPRHIPFSQFINFILTRIGCRLRFESEAIMQKVGLNEVREFVDVGAVSFRYSTTGEKGADILRMCAFNPTDHAGTVEVIIRPKRGRDQKAAAIPALRAATESGARHIGVKGRHHEGEAMVEHYLDIGGRISREVSTHEAPENEVFARIHSITTESDEALDNLITTMTNGRTYGETHEDIDRLRAIDTADSWSRIGANA